MLDGLFLFISQVLFVSMDCIRIKAPRVRVMLGANIMLALIDGTAAPVLTLPLPLPQRLPARTSPRIACPAFDSAYPYP